MSLRLDGMNYGLFYTNEITQQNDNVAEDGGFATHANLGDSYLKLITGGTPWYICNDYPSNNLNFGTGGTLNSNVKLQITTSGAHIIPSLVTNLITYAGDITINANSGASNIILTCAEAQTSTLKCTNITNTGDLNIRVGTSPDFDNIVYVQGSIYVRTNDRNDDEIRLQNYNSGVVGTGFWNIYSSSSLAFNPMMTFYSESSTASNYIQAICQNSDTGSDPVLAIRATRLGTSTPPSFSNQGSITTRPLIGVFNANTKYFQITYDGKIQADSIDGLSNLGAINVGSFVLNANDISAAVISFNLNSNLNSDSGTCFKLIGSQNNSPISTADLLTFTNDNLDVAKVGSDGTFYTNNLQGYATGNVITIGDISLNGSTFSSASDIIFSPTGALILMTDPNPNSDTFQVRGLVSSEGQIRMGSYSGSTFRANILNWVSSTHSMRRTYSITTDTVSGTNPAIYENCAVGASGATTSPVLNRKCHMLLNGNTAGTLGVDYFEEFFIERNRVGFGEIIAIKQVASDPASPSNNDIWVRSDTQEIKCRISGVTYKVALTV